jgi:hypothetical protein
MPLRSRTSRRQICRAPWSRSLFRLRTGKRRPCSPQDASGTTPPTRSSSESSWSGPARRACGSPARKGSSCGQRQAAPAIAARDDLERRAPVRRVAVADERDRPSRLLLRDAKLTDLHSPALLDDAARRVWLVACHGRGGHDAVAQSTVAARVLGIPGGSAEARRLRRNEPRRRDLGLAELGTRVSRGADGDGDHERGADGGGAEGPACLAPSEKRAPPHGVFDQEHGEPGSQQCEHENHDPGLGVDPGRWRRTRRRR